MSVLLALVSALACGLSDFVGGLVSRRASLYPAATILHAATVLHERIRRPQAPGLLCGVTVSLLALD